MKHNRWKKILALCLVVLLIYTSIRFIFLKPKKVLAADVFIGLNEGYGGSASDTNSTATAGTITNAVWKTEDLCKIGKCLYFDGTGDYVTYVDNANLDMAAADTVTVEAWFRTQAITSGTRTLISKYKSSTGTDGGYKITMNSSGQIMFGIDSDNTSFPAYSVSSTSRYDDNLWHHVAAVKDGTSAMTLYVDAKIAGTTSITSTDASNTDNFMIGRDESNTSNDWNGFVDEVKVLRTARTQIQIETDYNGETPSRGTAASFGPDNKWISNGLVGYWKMDEVLQGSARTDSSGLGTTLTDTNTVATASGKFADGGDFEMDSSQYDSAADNSALSITGGLTLSAWINPESVSAGTYNIIAKWDGANDSYRLMQDGDEIRIEIDSSGNYVETTASNLAAGTWYHVVGVYDSVTSTAHVYINGTEAASTITGTIPSSIGDDAGGFQIGAEDLNNTPKNFYDGIIDEARAYSRALSPAEVQQLYNWAPGPFGYWKLDEGTSNKAYDSSGSNITGTVDNPTTTRWKTGKFGTGIETSNTVSNDHITLSNSASIKSTYAFTTEAWVYPTSKGTSGRGRYFYAENTSINGGYGRNTVGVLNSTSGCGAGVFGAYFLSANDTGTGSTVLCDPTVFTLNRWYHVTAVYNSVTDKHKLYVNGVLVFTLSKSASVMDPSNPLSTPVLGNWTSSSGYAFPGTFDEVKLYNYERTPSQIIEDMNGGHPAPGGPVGSATAEWHFDEGYGDTINNSGSSGSVANGNLAGSGTTCPASGACPTWTNSGKYGKALDFDGTDDYIDAGSDTSVDNIFDAGGTVTAWVYADTYGGSSLGRIIDKYNGDTAFMVCNNGTNCTNTIAFVRLFSNSAWWKAPDNSFSTGAWKFIAVSYDSSSLNNQPSFYINGLLVPTVTITSPTGTLVSDGTGNLYIGNRQTTARPFDGIIDDLKIYRAVLTDDQIKVLYNQGSATVLGSLSDTSQLSGGSVASNSASAAYCVPGSSDPCSPPVGEWKLDEGSDSTINDTSGKANTLTDYGNVIVDGKFGNARNYNNNYSKFVGNNTGISGDAAFTMEGWVYPTSLTSVSQMTFGLLGPNASDYKSAALIFSMDQTGDFGIHFANCGYETDAAVLQNNNWYHVVAVKTPGVTSSSTITLYVNGVSYPFHNWTGGAASCTPNLDIQKINFGRGWTWEDTSYPYYGRLDDLKVYNYARSPAQVAWDYNRGGPVGWWKMDEASWNNDCATNTVFDSSGNSFHGFSCPAGTGQTTPEAGKFNTAMHFDDADDYVIVADNNSLDLTSRLSISAWVNTDANEADNVIVSKGTSYEVGINADGDVYWDGGSVQDDASAKVLTGSWHHIVVTNDDTTVTYYVDGIQTGTDAAGIGADNATALYIGYDGTNYFDGLIDDVRVYNYALTQQQIQLLYNGGAAVLFTK